MSPSYFSPLHASKESQFYDLPHGIEDSPEIQALRKVLEAGEANAYELHIALADRLCFQMRFREAVEEYTKALDIIPGTFLALRKRAPRYLCILEPAKAYEDLLACAKKSPSSLELEYRLGIACYMKGETGLAEAFFSHCMELAAENQEMLAASSFWMAVSSLKTASGDMRWMGYDFAAPITIQTGYRNALLALCGHITPEEACIEAAASHNALDGIIVLFGAYSCFLSQGDEEKAAMALGTLVAWDSFWPSFAYLAAYMEWDRVRLRKAMG